MDGSSHCWTLHPSHLCRRQHDVLVVEIFQLLQFKPFVCQDSDLDVEKETKQLTQDSARIQRLKKKDLTHLDGWFS